MSKVFKPYAHLTKYQRELIQNVGKGISAFSLLGGYRGGKTESFVRAAINIACERPGYTCALVTKESAKEWAAKIRGMGFPCRARGTTIRGVKGLWTMEVHQCK